jgi:hypothetical protein
MRHLRLIVALALTIGLAVVASAADMTLTNSGDLYRVALTEGGLAVTATLGDESIVELLVPQTAGIVTPSYHLGVDENSGAVFVLWQENEGPDATVVFASHSEDTWYGPTVLAGGDGTAAVNPQMLVFRHSKTFAPEEEGGEPIVVEDSILHLVWWSFEDAIRDGGAVYSSVPVDDFGLPIFDDVDVRPLTDLLAYGIACPEITNAGRLAHPRLFVDPQSGNPHVFATDIGQCLFQILELEYQPEFDSITKRRRRVVIFGRSRMAPVRADLKLATARVQVGHNLALVIYWNKGDAVDYLKLTEEGWTDMRSLALGDGIGLERALELIKNLAH